MMDEAKKKPLDEIQSIIDDIMIKMQVMQEMKTQIKTALHIIDGKVANIIHDAKD